MALCALCYELSAGRGEVPVFTRIFLVYTRNLILIPFSARIMTSQSSHRKPRYIYELPYLPHRDLARILDDNNQWKDLGILFLQII